MTTIDDFDGGRMFVDGRFRKADRRRTRHRGRDRGDPRRRLVGNRSRDRRRRRRGRHGPRAAGAPRPPPNAPRCCVRFADALAARAADDQRAVHARERHADPAVAGRKRRLPRRAAALLRGPDRRRRRRGDPARHDRAHHRAARGRRRRRGDHAVELSPGAGGDEDRARRWPPDARWCSRRRPKPPWTQ